MTTRMQSYRLKYPDLVAAILTFFSDIKKDGSGIKLRTVGEFCNYYSIKRGLQMIQPEVVTRICLRIVDFGWMSQCRGGTISGVDDQYIIFVSDINAILQPSAIRLIECAVFGFPAVFSHYLNSVLPIVNEDIHGNKQIGSSFVIDSNKLATAHHCISGAVISCKNVKLEHWINASVFVHDKQNMDLAIIIFSEPIFSQVPAFPIADRQILDEVMALGFPDVPGYLSTLAAEKATIATRFTAATGRIASAATDIWTSENSFLITARVKGGFSGGPLIDTFGQVVGVVVREPASYENDIHQYSDAGYGIAATSAALQKIAEKAAGGGNPANMQSTRYADFE